VQSWDCAFKTGQSNDYSACVTVGELQDRGRDGAMAGLYLLQVWHGRVGFADLKRRAVEFACQWRVDAVLIGPVAHTRVACRHNLPLYPVRVDGDKNVRAAAAQPAIEAGRVLLPAGAAWAEEFLAEVCALPAGAHDDQVDALTQAIG
jgi:predicted phage terminase large subunit-like protein